jgi:DNA-binding MarR family transcriptional regulator
MTESDAAGTTSRSIAVAVEAQRIIFRSLLGSTASAWMQLELPIGQLRTLMTLATQEPLTVSALAERLHVGKSAASVLADRLVQQGYVARSEDLADRRRAVLALTPAGSELVTALGHGAVQSRFLGWLEQMPEGDLTALTRGLQALAAIAARDRYGVEP